MATSAQSTKSKPPSSGNSVHWFAPRRGTTTPNRRSAPSGSQSLVRRVQAILPGAKRAAKPNPAESLAAALERATSGATVRMPLSKGTLGILVGRAGAVTAAKPRHKIGSNELPATSSAHATNTGARDIPQRLETIDDRSATKGGDHGDPQGPDPATAA
jgi:hypothetical protein